ncbi:MAG: helix-turn-helix domain-containing protein [Spirochaetales bacterium]|jgi:transcriptional regulator with XRE-family HTH domain|nr:helix-turn-helix domain-containing protein [Spirochaetales bacterium]
MNPEQIKLRKIVAANLTQRRVFLEMTREELARAAGIPLNMLSGIEQCRRWPGDEALTRLAKALGMEAGALFFPPEP